jgi:hypothetical protein
MAIMENKMLFDIFPQKLAENETGIATSCSAIFTSRCISINVL